MPKDRKARSKKQELTFRKRPDSGKRECVVVGRNGSLGWSGVRRDLGVFICLFVYQHRLESISVSEDSAK